ASGRPAERSKFCGGPPYQRNLTGRRAPRDTASCRRLVDVRPGEISMTRAASHLARSSACIAALAAWMTVATAQTPWLDPTLLDAAKKEGALVVYSSINE